MIDDLIYSPITSEGIDEAAVKQRYYRRLGAIIDKYVTTELDKAARRTDDEVYQNSST